MDHKPGSGTILVTGGAGFIGGNFVLDARRRGRRVVNIDKLTYAGNLDTLASLDGDAGHVFVHGDIADRQLVAQLLEEHRPASIVHFAAESHVDRSIDGPAAFVATNVAGTLSLLEAARDYWRQLDDESESRFRFLHVSTDEVYGSLGPEGLFTEESPYDPRSPYSASKAASDHLVSAFHHTFGLPTLITHCSNNYGPYQFPEKLIPLIINRALQEAHLPVYGDGSNIRDWLHVEDHCRALNNILDGGTAGETYNIGGNAERRNLDVVLVVCALLDSLSPRSTGVPYSELIRFVDDRPGHDRRYAIDSRKLSRQLGWQPSRSFEEGIEATVRWYLDNTLWTQRVLDGAYRMERLGS